MSDDTQNKTHDTVLKMRPAGSEKHRRNLASLLSYWDSMRRNGDVPLRTEIDPRGIEDLLRNAFIAEKVSPGLARLRIAGSHLSEIMGMEVRGMPLSSLIDLSDRTVLSDALVDLFERPAKLRLEVSSPGSFRRAPMTGTLMLLPLRSDLGDISRALGCLVTTGEVGHTPRRFKITDLEITPIDLKDTSASARGFSEAQKKLSAPSPALSRDSAKKSNSSQRPYLRLVHSE